MPPVNPEAASLSGEHIQFSFGENWQQYLRGLDDRKIDQAQASLCTSFGSDDFAGRTFLDVGCGSGVFSLAAHRLGAVVTSVDVDPASVACAQHLRGDDEDWTVVRGSILQLSDIPLAERVYAWGVLHHTGAMWAAVDKTLALVEPDGLACIALYNKPHRPAAQLAVKRLYNRRGAAGRKFLELAYGLALLALSGLVHRRNPISYVRKYGENSRGMSFWRDVKDWLGGLPFEYTDVEEFRQHVPDDFDLVRVQERPPGACNEYLLRRRV